MADETKIIYHIDDEETPYLVKIPKPSDQVTLGDFKNVLNRPNYKFFFKSMDDDFGHEYSDISREGSSTMCYQNRGHLAKEYAQSCVVTAKSDGLPICKECL
eukprot:gene6870-12470_t